MIARETYLTKLRNWRDKQVIKVITGIRRCGKSTMFTLFINELLKEGIASDQIIQINLEDIEYEDLLDYRSLYSYVKERLVPGKMTYIFLDEIQHVRSFEKVLASFRATLNCSIFITGSNLQISYKWRESLSCIFWMR